MKHSNIVGGSTAKRVINCPGSVALVQQMPPQVESKYAAEGTLLHACMEEVLVYSKLSDVVRKHNLTDEQIDKLTFCISALDEIDPNQDMSFDQEKHVGFENVKGLEGVFGNVDLIGRVDDRVIILDWKFGDGVIVSAEENYQGLFYAAAAMSNSEFAWAFDGAKEIEIIIVQPPAMRRWVTTFERVAAFQAELQTAVTLATKPNAPLAIGDWCRWCTAKPICPKMTGEIDRVVHLKLDALAPEELGRALDLANKLESFINDARKLAFERLEKDMPVPGYKLVSKRATRQWSDEAKADAALASLGVPDSERHKKELISPAQAEKVLKKSKLALPDDLVIAVSSGSTLAPESDPRPAVLNVGLHLTAALSKLQ
jgi:Protein of unknown function (DUF2800)